MSDFIDIPDNPCPEGAELTTIAAKDGAALRVAYFPAPAKDTPARATAILMAGRTEFIEKYFETIHDLHARGLNVAMMDWRGQGLSHRPLPNSKGGHIDSFETFKEDLRLFIENGAMKRFDGPYILMTHSMGGMPGLQLLAEGYDKFIAAILCAPMTQIFQSNAERTGLTTLANVVSALGGAKIEVPAIPNESMTFEGNGFTTDKIRHQRFLDLQVAEPKAAINAPTFGWVHQAMKAINELHRPGYLDKVKIPTRIISASLDKTVYTPDHAVIADACAMIDRVVVEGGLHELLMERDEIRQGYWEAFDGFIEPILAKQ